MVIYTVSTTRLGGFAAQIVSGTPDLAFELKHDRTQEGRKRFPL
jgi:hypothetical protein